MNLQTNSYKSSIEKVTRHEDVVILLHNLNIYSYDCRLDRTNPSVFGVDSRITCPVTGDLWWRRQRDAHHRCLPGRPSLLRRHISSKVQTRSGQHLSMKQQDNDWNAEFKAFPFETTETLPHAALRVGFVSYFPLLEMSQSYSNVPHNFFSLSMEGANANNFRNWHSTVAEWSF